MKIVKVEPIIQQNELRVLYTLDNGNKYHLTPDALDVLLPYEGGGQAEVKITTIFMTGIKVILEQQLLGREVVLREGFGEFKTWRDVKFVE